MLSLPRHFRALNARYHGEEGDQFAIDELNPVARRFVSSSSAVLEVGCGYGRNLVALSRLRLRRLVGSDVSLDELVRARRRVADSSASPRTPVRLVQQEAFRLPFRDGTFDFVVLWQVLEHVFDPADKQRVIDECVRVLRNHGSILIETPNWLFPFDYHDNKLPLAHWIVPTAGRRWLTWKIRGQKYQPSEYTTVFGCGRLLRNAPNVVRVRKVTRLYFATGIAQAWRDLAGTHVALKRLIFIVVAPVHFIASLVGGSADFLLPSVRAVWRVEKGPAELPIGARPQTGDRTSEASRSDAAPAGASASR